VKLTLLIFAEKSRYVSASEEKVTSEANVTIFAEKSGYVSASEEKVTSSEANVTNFRWKVGLRSASEEKVTSSEEKEISSVLFFTSWDKWTFYRLNSEDSFISSEDNLTNVEKSSLAVKIASVAGKADSTHLLWMKLFNSAVH